MFSHGEFGCVMSKPATDSSHTPEVSSSSLSETAPFLDFLRLLCYRRV